MHRFAFVIRRDFSQNCARQHSVFFSRKTVSRQPDMVCHCQVRCAECGELWYSEYLEKCRVCDETYCNTCRPSCGLYMEEVFYCLLDCATRGVVVMLRDFLQDELDDNETKFNETLDAITTALRTDTADDWLGEFRWFLRDRIESDKEFDIAWNCFRDSLIPEDVDNLITDLWHAKRACPIKYW